MKAASTQQIRQQLRHLDKNELIDICSRLSRFKNENKELISYLLFDAQDEANYIVLVKQQMDELFIEVNTSHVFYAKKTLRKILRTANKHIRIMASKTAEVEILLHFLTNFKGINMNWQKTKLLRNMYESQIKKAETAIFTLHEDLQYDYKRTLERLKVV